MPASGAVKLTVHDILGRTVDTLVDDCMSPGTYSVNWNAADMASGTYFYTLEAGSARMTLKMLLIK